MSNPQYYVMKGIISELPEEDQNKIKSISEEIKEIVKKNGDAGLIAIGLCALEIEEESE